MENQIVSEGDASGASFENVPPNLLHSDHLRLTSKLLKKQRDWRQSVLSGEIWQRDPTAQNIAGEAGGYRVLSDGYEYGGYLKPTILCDETHTRAANEKIVADLAFELNLWFAPVVLYRRDAQECPSEEHRCCVSLVMYPVHSEMLEFLHASSTAAQADMADKMREASPNLALDIFVGRTERTNPRNVILGTFSEDEIVGSLVFLDNADTMNCGHAWEGTGWRQYISLPVPKALRENLDRPALAKKATEISKLSSQTICEIVSRIPDDYMTSENKEVVLRGLLGRRKLIESFVAKFAAGPGAMQ
jgi:hypothetical protein